MTNSGVWWSSAGVWREREYFYHWGVYCTFSRSTFCRIACVCACLSWLRVSQVTSSVCIVSVLLLIACLSGKQVLWTTCLLMLWSLLWCKWSKGQYPSKVTSCRAVHVWAINACTHEHAHPHWYLSYSLVSRAPISACVSVLVWLASGLQYTQTHSVVQCAS